MLVRMLSFEREGEEDLDDFMGRGGMESRDGVDDWMSHGALLWEY